MFIEGMQPTEPTQPIENNPVDPAGDNGTPPAQEPVNVQQPQGEKTFTQTDIDRIVGERLSRERQKYTPYQSFVESQAQQYGMTPDEYLQAVEQQKQEEKNQQFQQQYGIDPEAISKALENHPDMIYARELRAQQEEQQKLNAQAEELFTEFPNLNPQDIPTEVFQLQVEKGLSLLDAYLRVSHKTQPDINQLKQQAITEYIEKLKTGNKPVEGSGSGPVIINQEPRTFDDARKGALNLLRQVNQN